MKLNIGVRLQNDLLKIDINSINVDKEEIKEIIEYIEELSKKRILVEDIQDIIEEN